VSNRTFSIGEALDFGWNAMKARPGFFVALVLTIGAAACVFTVVSKMFAAAADVGADAAVITPAFRAAMLALSFIVQLAGVALNMILSLGLIRITLDACDGKKGTYADLFSRAYLFPRYLWGSALYGLTMLAAGGAPVAVWVAIATATGAGAGTVGTVALLLVIPAVYLAVRLSLYGYCVVDGDLGGRASLRRSFDLTRGCVGRLILFGVVAGLINIAGALCLLIGLLATLPITYIAFAFVYRKLQSAAAAQGVLSGVADGSAC